MGGIMSHHDHKVIIAHQIIENAMQRSEEHTTENPNIIVELIRTLYIILPHTLEVWLQAIEKSALI